MALIVGLLALALSGTVLWFTSLDTISSRWNGLLHDRHEHYRYALKMSLALREANAPRFLAELSKGKTWPPLHGLLACTAITLWPGDWRVAMLPSLGGWVLMLAMVFLITHRLASFAGPPLAWIAALIALLFAIESPAHRAFALDIMLESLGASLTLLVLYCYAGAVSGGTAAAKWWKATAIALTLLFFEKYNYWMIATLGLAVAEFARARIPLSSLLASLSGLNWKALLRCPLNWLVAILTLVVLWIGLRGPTTLAIGGRSISIYPPNNLLTLAYALALVRVTIGIRKTGWRPASDATRSLWYWHVLPVVLSLLIPQRLGALIGFLSPTNYGDARVHSLPGTLAFYWKAAGEDYHAATGLAALAVIAALGVAFAFRRLSPAHVAVIACLLIGSILVILHPNQKSRFLHSWIPCLWVLAGVGVANRAMLARNRYFGIAGALLFAGAVGWFGAPGPPHSRESGHLGETGSLLSVSDEWLRVLPQGERICFIATQPCRPFVEWTFLQERPAAEFDWKEWPSDLSTGKLREEVSAWLATTEVRTLVVIDVPREARAFYRIGDRPRLRALLPEVLATQTRFKATREINNAFFGTQTSILTRNSAQR